MDLDYELWGAGWAMATIRSGAHEIKAVASYLHDSLLELAGAAIRLSNGAPEANVVFMDEPGEHHLVLQRREGRQLAFEVRWYDDWASWGIHPPDRYTVALKGMTTVRRFRHQVLNVLWRLDQTLGPERYKEQWIEADFPSEEYAKLKAM